MQVAYFLNAQTRAGGFPGREGPADLYYTAFGLRALSVLGRLEGETADLAVRYLRSQLSERHSIVDLFSLIYAAQLLHAASGIDVLDQAPAWPCACPSCWPACVATTEASRGRWKGIEGAPTRPSSALLCLQLLEQPIERPESIAEFLLHQRSPEGGFLEDPGCQAGGGQSDRGGRRWLADSRSADPRNRRRDGRLPVAVAGRRRGFLARPILESRWPIC